MREQSAIDVYEPTNTAPWDAAAERLATKALPHPA